MEKVSIIVPVYNAAEYVGKCLESVALQDYKNIEIIVVEDGSDDESPDVCKEYARRYDNIKVYHDKCGTAGAARNYGMSKAAGDYVMFVDADDYLTDNCVVSELIKKNGECGYSSWKLPEIVEEQAFGCFKKQWICRIKYEFSGFCFWWIFFNRDIVVCMGKVV